MAIQRAIPVLRSAGIDPARAFYIDFLGFEAGMDDPGFLMLRSPDVPTTQLIIGSEQDTNDLKIRDVDVSVGVDNVEQLYEDARRRGLDIVYPLTDEPWGIRRFFVRDPDGHVINVASHRG